jgi:curli production assembly/transport component CsgG
VREAIEAAVVHLIVQGLKDKLWALKNEKDWDSSVVRAYLRESSEYLDHIEGDGADDAAKGQRS